MNGITYPPQALADPLVAAKAFVEQFSEQIPNPADIADARENDSPRIDWRWAEGTSPLANRLPPAPAIAIYRLTTEFVRNALRHANATRIEVSAALIDGVAVVKIHDDGCGFEPRDIDSSSSHGLALARRRAAAAEVRLEIESSRKSAPGAMPGTRVTLRTTLARSVSSQPQPDSPQPEFPQPTEPMQQAPR